MQKGFEHVGNKIDGMGSKLSSIESAVSRLESEMSCRLDDIKSILSEE